MGQIVAVKSSEMSVMESQDSHSIMMICPRNKINFIWANLKSEALCSPKLFLISTNLHDSHGFKAGVDLIILLGLDFP